MTKQDYLGAKKEIFRRLKKLPKSCFFHDILHTKDVLRGVEKLSLLEGIKGYKLLLLKTAAVCHDIGHLFGAKEHEKAGVRMIKKILPTHGYNAKDIKIISKIIMATKMPQNPKTKVQKIICDADLDNLGREDYFVRSELLRLELAKQGIHKTAKEWYEFSLKFLQEHNYFTESAKNLRQKKKEQNIEEIKELLGIN